MILFVGLGNPGEEYSKTPHNSGFMAMDKLRYSLGHSGVCNVGEWEFDKYSQSQLCIGKLDSEIKFMLCKPLTFMNKSGRSVEFLVRKNDINIQTELVLFYDDLDIKLGDFKMSRKKYPKGHNGIVNVVKMIHSFDFLSIRLGIENRENMNIPGEDYVLKPYSDEELEVLNKAISESIKKLRLNISL